MANPLNDVIVLVMSSAKGSGQEALCPCDSGYKGNLDGNNKRLA